MRNWAGNRAYGARRLLEPGSMDELRAAVAASAQLRPVGTRHSFSAVGDTDGDLVSLAGLPRRVEIDAAAATVTIDGGATYADVGQAIQAAGFALGNLPSLPHITVAGACATGTHGSGDRHGVLATSMVGLELVVADGSLQRLHADAPGAIPLQAAAVSLGALGIVTATTLRLEPARDVRQDVYERLPTRAFDDAFEAANELADSASFFHTWREDVIDQVWLKRRLPGTGDRPLPRRLLGATPATRDLHPIRDLPADACTLQLGVPGPWHERLPHFRASHVPSSGAELQSEYFVPRAEVGRAFRALDAMRDTIGPLVQVGEIRTVAPDDLWLSPAHDRASATFHFTWIDDERRVRAALPAVEAALAPFDPRHHWAKLAAGGPRAARASYPRLAAFAAVAARLDPAGKLRNRFLDDLLGDPR
jgi:xylitol oxidase